MSTDVFQEIMTAFDPRALEELERELGVDGRKTREATGAAVGTILEGLRRRAEPAGGGGQQGGGGLEDLLERFRRHQEQAPSRPEAGSTRAPRLDPDHAKDIFGDIFGRQAPDVQKRFEKTVQIDPAKVMKVLGAVLPVVLGALAKARSAGAGPRSASPGGGLGDVLGRARQDFDRQAPQPRRGGGLLEVILDRDHDGDVDLGDLAGIFLDRR